MATEECVLWALDRTTFRQLVLLTTMKKREMYEAFLNAIPLLQELEVCVSSTYYIWTTYALYFMLLNSTTVHTH